MVFGTSLGERRAISDLRSEMILVETNFQLNWDIWPQWLASAGEDRTPCHVVVAQNLHNFCTHRTSPVPALVLASWARRHGDRK